MKAPPSELPEVFHHYFRMWNDRDPERIRGHLDRAVSKVCLRIDPQNAHTGRDALEENVRIFRAKFPDADLGIASNVDGHHDRYRYEWKIEVGGEVLLRGFDVTTLDGQGLIERVDGFFGELTRTS